MAEIPKTPSSWKPPRAAWSSNCGPIVAPSTWSASRRSPKGFYDGMPFHRVIEGFMAQTGDPTGTGTGGSEQPDLKAEFNAEPHVRGVCSMARANSPEFAPTASSSSASTTPPSSTSNTPSGAR